MNTLDFCTIKPYKPMMQNSLWHYDAYPDLPELKPNSSIELGDFSGPGVVRTIHLTMNIEESGARDDLLRGVYLSVRYDGRSAQSVNVPVGDFFCDSFNGESINFASMVMAKRPTNSLSCYLPMPFKKQVLLSLINKTDKTVTGYGYVTADKIPEWNNEYGYFHASFVDQTVRLPMDIVSVLDIKGAGHFAGCHFTAVSSCPHFAENHGICEGNDEFYIDGSTEPALNYLGTEDFFGFSWNWQKLWYDNYAGTTFLSCGGGTTKLACYRFFINDPVRFSESLKFQINYRNEINDGALNRAKEEGNGYVRYCIVPYWYQHLPADAV
jgi:hypothetical protein